MIPYRGRETLGIKVHELKRTVRAFSTRRPTKKTNSPYTFQNVQASFSYLFNNNKGAASNTSAESSKQSQSKSTPLELKEAQRTARQISFKYLFDSNRQTQGTGAKERAAERPPESSEGAASSKKTGESSASNQVATLRYLFAGKAADQQQSRRGRKKDIQGGKASSRFTNEELKHKNLLASLKFLFGSDYVML